MVDYHPYSDAIYDDPYPVYKRLRDDSPAHYIGEFDCWFLSRFEDIWQTNLNFKALSSAQGSTTGQLLVQDTPVNPSLAGLDPPRHTLHRGLISPTFKPGAVSALEPRVRAFARDALAPCLERGEIDAVRDYALRIASQTVCLIGGLPFEDAPRMVPWVNAIFEREDGHRGCTANGLQAMRDMFFYFLELVKERRSDPEACEGLLRLFLSTDVDGGFDDGQIASTLSLLLTGGTDTFPKALSNTIYQLWRHPEQKAEVLARPDLGLAAFNETLRYNTPTQMLGRTLLEDIEIHGQTLRKGQKLMFLWASANRDEREFDDPDRFDLHRRPPRILAFGAGPHLCLGMHVAKLEARVALEELFGAVRDYHVEEKRSARLRTEFVQGFTSLPVTFERR